MANTKEIQDRIKSINDTLKNYKCHVYDFFFKAEKVKENAGRYGTIFLYAAVGNESNLKTSSGYGRYIF